MVRHQLIDFLYNVLYVLHNDQPDRGPEIIKLINIE